jgi:hypothetical protein
MCIYEYVYFEEFICIYYTYFNRKTSLLVSEVGQAVAGTFIYTYTYIDRTCANIIIFIYIYLCIIYMYWWGDSVTCIGSRAGCSRCICILRSICLYMYVHVHMYIYEYVYFEVYEYLYVWIYVCTIWDWCTCIRSWAGCSSYISRILS